MITMDFLMFYLLYPCFYLILATSMMHLPEHCLHICQK